MSPLQELRFLILAAQRTGSRAMSAVLKPLGLTPAQAEVLQVLAEFGPITLRTLGALLICETGSPSRLAAGLVDRGLVGRLAVDEDRRAVLLCLTPAGETLLARAAEVESTLAKLIASAVTNEEITTLTAGLRKLADRRPRAPLHRSATSRSRRER
mgnify:CR=1 FL=1